MPRRFRVMKRIRNAWRRLFPRKIHEFEGFDEDNQMSENDLDEMLSGVSHYVEKMRAEHLKNIDMIRRGHDSLDDMDNKQNYYKRELIELEDTVDMKGGESQPSIIINKEEEITGIRCEEYGCEVLVQIRPIGQ